MDIEINGKEFTFNDNMRLGVMELIQSKPDDLKTIRIFIREALIPTPTAKELFNFREKDIEFISEKFAEFQDKRSTEIKKKLSR